MSIVRLDLLQNHESKSTFVCVVILKGMLLAYFQLKYVLSVCWVPFFFLKLDFESYMHLQGLA